MIIYIDYTVLSKSEKRKKRVKTINDHRSNGNEIHIWIEDTTVSLHTVVRKLEEWDCGFDHLKLGKPVYDLIVDDNGIKSDNFFSD